MQLKFKIELRKPSELLENPGEILNNIKHSDIKYYAGESKRFSHYQYPVTTPDGLLLSHIEDVQAAMYNGDEPIEVLVVENLDETDYLRFSLKTIHFRKMEEAERMAVITSIQSHFETEEGKAWKASLIKDGHKDINEQVAAILGCSPQLIKLIKGKMKKDAENTEDEGKEVDTKAINEQLVKEDMKLSFDHDKLTLIYKGEKQKLSYFKITQKDGHVTIKFKISELKLALENCSSNQIENQA